MNPAQHIYQQAIDVLMSDNIDYRQVVINLAKRYPNVLVELVHGVKEDWHVLVLNFLKKGEKINAIKELRNRTQYGLKEAKDIIDYAMHIGHIHGLHYDYGDSSYIPRINDEQKALAIKIAS